MIIACIKHINQNSKKEKVEAKSSSKDVANVWNAGIGQKRGKRKGTIT